MHGDSYITLELLIKINIFTYCLLSNKNMDSNRKREKIGRGIAIRYMNNYNHPYRKVLLFIINKLDKKILKFLFLKCQFNEGFKFINRH